MSPRAAVMTAPGAPIEVRDLPGPTIEPGGILLETIYSEVCGTDVHLWHGRLAGVPFPIVPGHVTVGRVTEMRGRVTGLDGRPIEVGDVVTFHDVHETCHRCWFCRMGAPNRCPHRRVYGITYGVSDGLLGGWSEVVYLKPGVGVIPLPERVSPRLLIAGGCGLATAIHAVDRAGIRIGDRVAVQGAGPVGLSAALLALLSGAGRVIIVGGPKARLAIASSMGIDEGLPLESTSPEDRIERVRELTEGRGADVTIEATGSSAAIPEGMLMTRDAGRYVIAGQYTDAGDVTINPHAMINRKHLDVRGVWGAGFDHFHRMVEVLERHGSRVGWERMIGRTYKLDEMSVALADVGAGRVLKAVVAPNG